MTAIEVAVARTIGPVSIWFSGMVAVLYGAPERFGAEVEFALHLIGSCSALLSVALGASAILLWWTGRVQGVRT